MVFPDFFIRQIHEVNEDDIDIFKMAFQVLNICLHQLGFARSTNTCDNLDVGSTVQLNDPVEIFCSCEIQGRNDTGENWRTDTEMIPKHDNLIGG